MDDPGAAARGRAPPPELCTTPPEPLDGWLGVTRLTAAGWESTPLDGVLLTPVEAGAVLWMGATGAGAATTGAGAGEAGVRITGFGGGFSPGVATSRRSAVTDACGARIETGGASDVAGPWRGARLRRDPEAERRGEDRACRRGR